MVAQNIFIRVEMKYYDAIQILEFLLGGSVSLPPRQTTETSTVYIRYSRTVCNLPSYVKIGTSKQTVKSVKTTHSGL